MSANFPTISIDLSAITHNYGLLHAEMTHGACAAVVKANAYGLGMVPVAKALSEAGCPQFFVATLAEGIELRSAIKEAPIYVFHGARSGQNKEFLAHRLIPILNDLAQIETWNNAGPCGLHIDTGMTRLGISPAEAQLVNIPQLKLVMSHLACGGDPSNPKNQQQLLQFRSVAQLFAGIPASFSNSSGIALGKDFHFDLARPGRALYGIMRGSKFPVGMKHVATLSAPVLQYRTLETDADVGYGATATAKAGSVLATVEIGYADGFRRALSHKISGYVGDISVPTVGVVSMDMVIVDVTAVPAHLRTPELRITFINKEQTVDKVADMVGTIGYEIFTGLGPRVKRVYTP